MTDERRNGYVWYVGCCTWKLQTVKLKAKEGGWGRRGVFVVMFRIGGGALRKKKRRGKVRRKYCCIEVCGDVCVGGCFWTCVWSILCSGGEYE